MISQTLSLKDQVTVLIGDFSVFLPEMVIVLGAIGLIFFELVYKNTLPRLKTVVSVTVLLIVGKVILETSAEGLYFNGAIQVTSTAIFFKLIFLLVMACVLLYPRQKELLKKGEYHFLLLMILLGSFLLLQVKNLLFFYLALELISISSYILVTFSFTSRGFEAGVKYLLFGAVASGLMLYGISLLYGLTGTLDIIDLSQMSLSSEWLQLAFWLFFIGILFKLTLVPMHIWSPDVFEAGPTPVIAFISILPKIAVILFAASFFIASHWMVVLPEIRTVLAFVAMLSLLVGNLSALAQKNAKRMMAYSSIAHAGMLVIGLLVSSDMGYAALSFYALVYAVLNLAAFYLLRLFQHNGFEYISDLAGLGRRKPLIGVLTLVTMIGLVGLPPTGGFTGKLLMFTALWDSFAITNDSSLLWLFIVGLLNAAIALFYYLKIPYFMFLKEPKVDKRLDFSNKDSAILIVLVFIILLSFFKADLLLNLLIEYNFAV